MNWAIWHRLYDTTPNLQARLQAVRQDIQTALHECAVGPIHIVSVCAGDGRDLIGALREHPRRADVDAWLLDTHSPALDRGRAMAARGGVDRQVRFRFADAALARSYQGIVPADLLILSGMLGHLRNPEALEFLGQLPMLCRKGGCVIWNRHLVFNNGHAQVQAIRDALGRTGFEEVTCTKLDADGFAVGRARFAGEGRPLDPEQVLFQFVGVRKLSERNTPVGTMALGDGGWCGRYRAAPSDTDVELLVGGDCSGPSETAIAALAAYLSRFQENLERVRGQLFLGWSYQPVRVVANSDETVGVQFRSRLPFLGERMIQDRPR